MTASGPLVGLRVVEFAGLGPAPYAAMLLADLGAEVVCIHRPGGAHAWITSMELPLNRGRHVLELDLRDPAQQRVAADLVAGADVLVEGFRPGVMERLGFGPAECRERNPGLIYARMTGWGQHGPLAGTAGHDLNFLALSGALNAIGPAAGPPTVPLNLIGDFGGGGMVLAFGVLAALWERTRSGQGQVIDAAILDGIGSLSTMLLGYLSAGRWTEERHANRLDGGDPSYSVYETADHGYVVVAAIEPRFWDEVVRILELTDLPDRTDRRSWPALRDRLAATFATRSRAHWTEVFDGSDACVSPVLTWTEAPNHPQVAARGAVARDDRGLTSPVVPVFSRTPGSRSRSVEETVDSVATLLQRWRQARQARQAGTETGSGG